jgi:hypothetical protein
MQIKVYNNIILVEVLVPSGHRLCALIPAIPL